MSILDGMETRLITINSSHKSSVAQLTTDFSVDLINAIPELRDRVMGASVETVGFMNLINNVRHPYNHLYFTLYTATSGNISLKATVPEGNYNWVEYAGVLETAMQLAIDDVLFGPALSVTAVPASLGAPAKIALFYDTPDPGAHIIIPYDRATAPYIIGMDQDILLNDVAGYLSFRPNLGGPMALLLHTRAMAGSRSSVNGDGSPSEALLTIPVRVPYGQADNIHLGGDNRPLALYSSGAHRNLANIDVTLKHLDGAVVDIGTGEMYVTFRVWLAQR